tara:strand:+ start:119 stop:1375 length:1257 start_codon:yes stop_codon:yes gene_type:complete
MKPWFEKEIAEADIIKFPEPKEKVIKMPSVAEYPDFISGVQDLQARRKQGQISQDSYDKLYTELIHRFMRKEDVENPWFMESPEGIMSLTKQLQNLPPDTDPAILDKINDYIQLAQDKKEDPEANIYTRISRKVKGIEDQDMQKYYKIVSKFMIGNGLSGKQIDAIINAINNNECVNLDELKRAQNSLENILFMYKNSLETQKYYNDLLMYQPASRIGPGEILFATHSKELIKGQKGDLTVMATGQEVEVKGGMFAGRFKDDDILPAAGYTNKSQQFEKKYRGIVRAVPSGIGYAALIQGMQSNKQQANNIYKDFQLILKDLFPNNPYQKQIVQAVKSGDAKKAQNLHGMANLAAYFGAKAGGMGILFINVKGGTATTSYAENLEQLLQAFDLKVDTAYPITQVPLNPFPKIGVTAKK